MSDETRNEAILRRLVAVPSVSRDEEAGVKVCLELMNEIGLATRLVPCHDDPGAVNVEGTFGTGKPVLCLTGHIDTVPFDGMVVDPLGERRDGRYYGRGTCDMKGGLAAILAAVEQIIREDRPLHGTILVVATASEETIKSGGHQLARDHPTVDGVVCAEPTSGRVAVAATGSLPLRIDVHGKPGHSSQAGSGINAIRAALPVVDALYAEFDDVVDVPHVGERRRGVNAGVIRGGLAQPVVPATCSVWMDIRIFPGETKGGLLERVDAVLRALEAATPGLRAAAAEERLDYSGNAYPAGTLAHRIHVTRGMKPFATAPSTRLVQSFRQALIDHGAPAEYTMMSGWGDIEFLATDHLVPAIYFGPGDVASAHANDEHIELAGYHQAVAVFKTAILRFLSEAA